MGRRIEYRVKHPPEPSMCGCGRPLHRGMCSAKLAKFMPQRRQKRAEAWRAGTKDRVAARIAKPPYLIAIERATADIWDLAVRDEVRQELALAFLSTGLEEEHFKGQAEILRRRISHTRFQTVSLHDVVPGSDSVTLMDKLSNESQAMAYDGIEWHRGRHGWQPDD